MLSIFSHPNPMIVANAYNVLRADGIACQMRNYYAIGATGGLACLDTWPQICLDRDEDAARARQLLAELNTIGQDWACRSCGEENASAFELCWCCGAAR